MAFRSLYLSQCDQKKDKDGALTNPQMIVLNVLSKLVFQTLFYLKIGNLWHFKKMYLFFLCPSQMMLFSACPTTRPSKQICFWKNFVVRKKGGKNTSYHISVMIKLLLWKHLCFGSPSTIIRFKLQIKLNKVLKFRSCVLCKMLKP